MGFDYTKKSADDFIKGYSDDELDERVAVFLTLDSWGVVLGKLSQSGWPDGEGTYIADIKGQLPAPKPLEPAKPGDLIRFINGSAVPEYVYLVTDNLTLIPVRTGSDLAKSYPPGVASSERITSYKRDAYEIITSLVLPD